jgi:hypothetical protein
MQCKPEEKEYSSGEGGGLSNHQEPRMEPVILQATAQRARIVTAGILISSWDHQMSELEEIREHFWVDLLISQMEKAR